MQLFLRPKLGSFFHEKLWTSYGPSKPLREGFVIIHVDIVWLHGTAIVAIEKASTIGKTDASHRAGAQPLLAAEVSNVILQPAYTLLPRLILELER